MDLGTVNKVTDQPDLRAQSFEHKLEEMYDSKFQDFDIGNNKLETQELVQSEKSIQPLGLRYSKTRRSDVIEEKKYSQLRKKIYWYKNFPEYESNLRPRGSAIFRHLPRFN